MASELQDTVVALQESRARILTGEERVRREIAEHLHGPVQGRLLALRAQLAEVVHRDGLPAEASLRLSGVVEEMGAVIQRDIAVLSRRLFPAIVRQGLIPSIQSLVDQFEASLNVSVNASPDLVAAERQNRALVPERTRLAAYRITYEALTNAVKHAPASTVSVRLEMAGPEGLDLRIEDDGPGFDPPSASEGLGLVTMRDYAAAVGGTCEIASSPGDGTTVVARLPMDDAGQAG
jgi:signal transduction histidine kinase